MADDDIYDLWLRVKEQETVKLPVFGKVASVRVEPDAAFNGMFVRKGKLKAWVSADARRFVTRVVLTLAETPGVFQSIEIFEGVDAWTKIEFRDVELNPELADELFTAPP
jgi:hypothetical protein